MQEFAEDLEAQGVTARIQELVEGAGRAPKCDSEEVAGKIGDLCKLARDVEKRVNDTREKYNRPLLNAQKTLKGKADGLLAPLLSASRQAPRRPQPLHPRRSRPPRRGAAQGRGRGARAREALERENIAPEVIAEVVQAPKVEAAPIARGDYGSRVGTTTVWHHEIESVRQLPDRLLKHAKVVETLDKLIAAEITPPSPPATTAPSASSSAAESRARDIQMALPAHITPDKFQRTVLTAVAQNPDLLKADRQSLILACYKAAQDALLPDGREAALVTFNTRKKIDGQWKTMKQVQYMPMVYGLRKKILQSGDVVASRSTSSTSRGREGHVPLRGRHRAAARHARASTFPTRKRPTTRSSRLTRSRP
jgi:hypothetical protein